MMMIEITEKKAEKLSEHIEESLRHMGKALQYVEEWMEGSEMGERRGSYGNRDAHTYTRYGNRYDGHGIDGMRDDDVWDDDDDMIRERRGRRRRSNGRYY